jgi:hypothetical protein
MSQGAWMGWRSPANVGRNLWEKKGMGGNRLDRPRVQNRRTLCVAVTDVTELQEVPEAQGRGHIFQGSGDYII